MQPKVLYIIMVNFVLYLFKVFSLISENKIIKIENNNDKHQDVYYCYLIHHVAYKPITTTKYLIGKSVSSYLSIKHIVS